MLTALSRPCRTMFFMLYVYDEPWTHTWLMRALPLRIKGVVTPNLFMDTTPSEEFVRMF